MLASSRGEIILVRSCPMDIWNVGYGAVIRGKNCSYQ